MESIRGKLDECIHELDLSNWSERRTFFLGRFYDLPTQLLLLAVLRPGDQFVDIGANIGMMSMLGARLVGPTGRVDSFEPNPVAGQRLEATAKRNGLNNIHLHRIALGDKESTAHLTVVSEHTGSGTLADLPAEASPHISARYEVPVRIGDTVLTQSGSRIALVKIDVEGFECYALRGLDKTISRDRPPIVCEIVPKHLSRAGSSAQELLELMRSHGYEVYGVDLRRRPIRYRLVLVPLADESASSGRWTNVLFVHPDRFPDSLRGYLQT